MPWSTALRIRCTSGSPSSSITALSTRVSSPCSTSSTRLPCWCARSRTRRGKRSKTWRIGSIRTSMIVSCSCVADALDVMDRLEQLGPRAGQRLGDPARELVELGPVDDQLAHQVQQVVELGEVDAHHARAHGRGGLSPRVVARPGGGRLGRRRFRSRGTRATLVRRAGQERRERRLRGAEVRGLAVLRAGALDRPAQRRGGLEELVERFAVEAERAVAAAREHLLEPVDVVLDRGEPDHAAVALERVQRPEHGGHQLGARAVPLEPQQHVVEGRELLAGVLEVDRNELGGDLELHQRELGLGVTDRRSSRSGRGAPRPGTASSRSPSRPS